jgi:hypothetical protein
MKKFLSFLILSTIVISGCSWQKSADQPEPPVATLATQGYFKLDTLTVDSKISSPVEISGQAQGPMFFEGSFPASIEDSKGQILGSGLAKAEGDWMTEKMVPFKATINFKTPTTKNGFIILKSDNPSGLPENEHSVKFPISF